MSARREWWQRIVVPVGAGVCLLHGGVYLAAHSAYYIVDQRFFGLDPKLVLAVDDYVIWGIVGFVIGVLVGALLRSRPIVAAFATCGVSAVVFALSALPEGIPLRELLVLYGEPFVASLVSVTLGALLAARWLRLNQEAAGG